MGLVLFDSDMHAHLCKTPAIGATTAAISGTDQTLAFSATLICPQGFCKSITPIPPFLIILSPNPLPTAPSPPPPTLCASLPSKFLNLSMSISNLSVLAVLLLFQQACFLSLLLFFFFSSSLSLFSLHCFSCCGTVAVSHRVYLPQLLSTYTPAGSTGVGREGAAEGWWWWGGGGCGGGGGDTGTWLSPRLFILSAAQWGLHSAHHPSPPPPPDAGTP